MDTENTHTHTHTVTSVSAIIRGCAKLRSTISTTFRALAKLAPRCLQQRSLSVLFHANNETITRIKQLIIVINRDRSDPILYILYLQHIFSLFHVHSEYLLSSKDISTRFATCKINVLNVLKIRETSTYKYGRCFSPVIYFFVYDRFISRIFTFALPISRGEIPAPQGMWRCILADERLRYIVPSCTNPVAKIRAAHSRTRESH